MPLYDYICTDCGHEFDRFLPVIRYKEPQTCSKCAGPGKRIIVAGHGGTHGDEAPWIESTNLALTNPNPNHEFGKRITNRTELKERMEAKGVVHLD